MGGGTAGYGIRVNALFPQRSYTAYRQWLDNISDPEQKLSPSIQDSSGKKNASPDEIAQW